MDEVIGRKWETEKAYGAKEYPLQPKPKTYRGAPRGAQRTLMDVFNSCGAYAALDWYETSSLVDLAKFTSKQGNSNQKGI